LTKGILERLADGPVLGDGGYLLELEKRGYVQAGPFTPEVVIENPDALAQLHSEFLRAGVDVLQTMTFYASDDKLATVGLAGKVDEINRTAVKIARRVAADGDALVAGNLSLTWAYLPEEASSADHVRELFDRQLHKQLEAGPPDFWIGETFSYLGEALLFVERARATGLPVMVTMSFEHPVPLSYEGDTPAECARRLRDSGADVVGVNCLNGPEQALLTASWRRNRSPTGRRPNTPTSRHCRVFPTNSIHCRFRARRWRTSHDRRATQTSTTSGRAADRCMPTYEPWPRCWTSFPPRSVTGRVRPIER